MNSIANSQYSEDQYIANLAGMQAGKKPIGSMINIMPTSSKTSYLQQNCASIIGSITGGFITTFGVLAYPLVNSAMRSEHL